MKHRAQFFVIGSSKRCLLAVQQTAPAAGLVDVQIGMLRNQHDPRAFLHVAVIGYVVINPVRRLNPARERFRNEIRERHNIRWRGKNFTVSFCRIPSEDKSPLIPLFQRGKSAFNLATHSLRGIQAFSCSIGGFSGSPLYKRGVRGRFFPLLPPLLLTCSAAQPERLPRCSAPGHAACYGSRARHR